MAEGLANMGQNISRAVNVSTNQDTRASQLLDLQLEGAAIDNDIRRTELIERQNRLIPGPALPSPTDSHVIPGQGNSHVIKKAEITASAPGNPAQSPAAVTDYGLTRTRSGGYAVVPSKDVKELIEDQTVPEIEWAVRNRLSPVLTGHKPPDPKHYPLPKGYNRWEWQPVLQEFRAVDSYGNVQGLESGSMKWKINRYLKGGK